jgi:hypothetical protein
MRHVIAAALVARPALIAFFLVAFGGGICDASHTKHGMSIFMYDVDSCGEGVTMSPCIAFRYEYCFFWLGQRTANTFRKQLLYTKPFDVKVETALARRVDIRGRSRDKFHTARDGHARMRRKSGHTPELFSRESVP